jgi:hypothetical protein
MNSRMNDEMKAFDMEKERLEAAPRINATTAAVAGARLGKAEKWTFSLRSSI